MGLSVALPILRMVLYGRIVGPVFAHLILVLLICTRILIAPVKLSLPTSTRRGAWMEQRDQAC